MEAIEAGRDRLVELTSTLIRFDTTAREGDGSAHDEAALQEHLGGLLAVAGAEVEIWEPRPNEVSGTRQIPGPLSFAGRPQMAARFAGSGGGRSLLLNGHIDVVPSEPRDRWTSDPNAAEVRGGNLYGRGACDMKGGVAAMTFAAIALAEAGVRLRGDLIVNTVTDEETSGAGGLAAVSHGVKADAGIVTEPTGVRRVGGMPRVAVADDHGRGPPRARRDGPAALARRRRRERHREDVGRAGGDPRAARGVARAHRQAPSPPVAERHRPGHHQRRRVGGHLSRPAAPSRAS